MYLEMKHSQTPLCCLYVEIATVQMLGQTKKFPLTCSFQKGPAKSYSNAHI